METGVRKMDPVSRGRLAKHAATMTPAAASYLFRSMVAFFAPAGGFFAAGTSDG
jgi:hypothetical protein